MALDGTDISGEDVMMNSPPRLERLQLLDYPRTPLSIARSSGLQVPLPTDDGGFSREARQNLMCRTNKAYRRCVDIHVLLSVQVYFTIAMYFLP